MLAHVLWTILGCGVVFTLAGYFYVRMVYATGYQHGAEDVMVKLSNPKYQQLRKEPARG